MLRLAVDESVHGGVSSGLRQLLPSLDLVRVQDVGLGGTDDPRVLEWAAGEGRVLITADRKTMVGYAERRVAEGLPMPGLLVIRKRTPIGRAVEDLGLVAECLSPEECEGRIRFIPIS